MSQPPTSKSTKSQPSESGALKPALRDALVSLDIHLEEELARYRRLRDGHPPPPRNFGATRPRKSLDLMSFEGSVASAAMPTAASSNPSVNNAAASNSSAPAPPSSGNGAAATGPESAPATHPPTVPPSSSLGQQALNIQPGGASVAGLNAANGTASPTHAAADSATTTSSSAIAPVPRFQTESAPNATATAPNPTEPAMPSDYLASSEHLLQSLSDGEISPTAGSAVSPIARSRSLSSRLLSPVGLGLFLLLIVGSSLLGYILVNPSSINHLNIARWFGASKTDSEAGNSGSDATTSGDLPQGPNLADQEFVNLEVDNLSLLQNNGGSTELPVIPPLPNPQPDGATPSPNASSNALSQLPLPGQIPAESPTPAAPQAPPVAPSPSTPRQSAPRPAAAPAPAPSVSAKPSPTEVTKNPYYYVIADYINDRALTLAKDVVPGAYVSAEFPELGRPPIQLGAFYTQSEAERMAQELQKKGIPARVYKR